ncbi:MAG: hypothetical protein ACFFCS_07000 [Candidatus Hodarchaeota archaeon]
MTEEKKEKSIVQKRIEQLVAAVVGTCLTWWVRNLYLGTGINSTIASAGIGLIGGLVLKDHFAIFFAGTFAGMSSAGAVPNIFYAALIGGILWVIWVLQEKMFAGCGGKFGQIAMWAGMLGTLFVPIFTPTYQHKILINWANPAAPWTGLTWVNWVFSPILMGVAAMFTFYLRNNKPRVVNTTVASAIVGLLGGFIILTGVGISETLWTGTSYASAFTAYVYTGSFVGMAGTNRLCWLEDEEKTPLINDYLGFLITGAIAGILFLAIAGIFGYGGKYGFTAFCSVLIFDKLVKPLMNKIGGKEKAPAEKKE